MRFFRLGCGLVCLITLTQPAFLLASEGICGATAATRHRDLVISHIGGYCNASVHRCATKKVESCRVQESMAAQLDAKDAKPYAFKRVDAYEGGIGAFATGT